MSIYKERIDQLVERLELLPHPEGGFYKETYRSKGLISKDSLPAEFEGERNYSTCIYFLLTSENFSAFHRIRQDEIWHFYLGSPVTLHIISPDGEYSASEVGHHIEKGEVPQLAILAGHWFAAEVKAKNAFCLVGCTVAPGFNFADFELAGREALQNKFPEHIEIIARLTRV